MNNLESYTRTAFVKSCTREASVLEKRMKLLPRWPSARRYARSLIFSSLMSVRPKCGIILGVAILDPISKSCASVQPLIVRRGCSGVSVIFFPVRSVICTTLLTVRVKKLVLTAFCILSSSFMVKMSLVLCSKSCMGSSLPSSSVMSESPVMHLPLPRLPQMSITCALVRSMWMGLESEVVCPILT